MSAHLNTLPEPITTESKAYSLLKQEEQHAKKVKELREELDQAIQSLEELKNAAAWAEETYDLNEYLWENEDDVVPFMTLIEIRRTTHAAMRNVFSQAKEALA
jgi:glutamine synthetase type III